MRGLGGFSIQGKGFNPFKGVLTTSRTMMAGPDCGLSTGASFLKRRRRQERGRRDANPGAPIGKVAGSL